MAAKLTIKTNGQTLITALYKQDGTTAVSVFSDQNLSSATTVGTITADTTYWVAADDYYLLSVTQLDGSEIANSNGGRLHRYLAAGSPVEVSPMPTRAQAVADLPLFKNGTVGVRDFLVNGSGLTYRENIPRWAANSSVSALTSGVMYSAALPLLAGDVVTSLTWVSGGTGATTPTAWWFALYSNAATPALLQQTADQTTTAWSAGVAKTVALASPVTITTSGVYYAAIMMAAATPVTLAGIATQATPSAGAFLSGAFPLARTSGSGLTTTAPATIASPTSVSNTAYVVAS